jgi:hypothetical protein
MTTKVSVKIEGVITRRLQSKIHNFFPSSTDPVRKVLFEQSPSSALGAMADVYDADGGGAPVKRGGLVQRHQGKGERVNEAKGGAASRPAREEGGGAERVFPPRRLKGIEARRRGKTGLSRESRGPCILVLPHSGWLTIVTSIFVVLQIRQLLVRKEPGLSRLVRPNRLRQS